MIGTTTATVADAMFTATATTVRAAVAPEAFNVLGSHESSQPGTYPLSFSVQDVLPTGDAPDASSVTAPANVVPALQAAPTVAGSSRFGDHNLPTTLVLFYGSALDPVSASNLANHRIIGPAPARRTSTSGRTGRSASTRRSTTPSPTPLPCFLHGKLNVHLKKL